MRREPDYAALAERACRNAKPVPPETVEYLASIFGPAARARLTADTSDEAPVNAGSEAA
jgi:hypothetical protein